MHVTCRDLGRFSGMGHACYMHGLVPKFHACFMHVPCMKNMNISCMKPACSRCIPCVVQAYSKHDTGVFHAWYMCIPCVIQAYSMRSTGAFHDTGIFHSCVHTQYSYRHILITLGQSTCTYTCCKHKALCSCIGKYALYRYVDTGFKENRQSLLAPMDMHIML